jgi:thiol-disulfide isomerase/thioredoxin
MSRIALLTFFYCLVLFGANAQSPEALHKLLQMPKDSLPYMKNPTLPSFNVLLLDSATVYNTATIPEGRPSVIMFFSPTCGHCKLATEHLLSRMDSLKNIDFYLVSNAHNVTDIMKFSKEYHLGDYPNIQLVGQDYEFFFISFYAAKFVPDFALYDKHKKLVSLFESNVTVKELYDATH